MMSICHQLTKRPNTPWVIDWGVSFFIAIVGFGSAFVTRPYINDMEDKLDLVTRLSGILFLTVSYNPSPVTSPVDPLFLSPASHVPCTGMLAPFRVCDCYLTALLHHYIAATTRSASSA